MERNIKCEICGKYFSIKGIVYHKWRVHGSGVGFSTRKNGEYRPPWNKGLTKETSEAVARQAASLRRKKSTLEEKLDDDGKLIQKWRNKCVNALHENIPFSLTFDQFCTLVNEANLVSSDLGYSGHDYVLARYNDVGGYEYENCRFITQKDNNDEKLSHMTFTRIRCIEDGREFDSVKSAASYYGVHPDTIFNYIKTGKKIISKNISFIKI